jgi:tetratricopeptide (TPR) repeat protein
MNLEFGTSKDGKDLRPSSPDYSSELVDGALHDLERARELIGGKGRGRNGSNRFLELAKSEFDMGLDWNNSMIAMFGVSEPKVSNTLGYLKSSMMDFYIHVGDMKRAHAFYKALDLPRNSNEIEIKPYLAYAQALSDDGQDSKAESVLYDTTEIFSYHYLDRDTFPLDGRSKISNYMDIARVANRIGVDPRFLLREGKEMLVEISKSGHLHGFTVGDVASAFAECGLIEEALEIAETYEPEIEGDINVVYSRISEAMFERGDYSEAYDVSRLQTEGEPSAEMLSKIVVLAAEKNEFHPEYATALQERINELDDTQTKALLYARQAYALRILGDDNGSNESFKKSQEIATELNSARVFTEIAILQSKVGLDTREAFLEAFNISSPFIRESEGDNKVDDVLDLFERAEDLSDVALACSEFGYYDISEQILEELVPAEYFSPFGGTGTEDWEEEKVNILLHMAKSKMKRAQIN